MRNELNIVDLFCGAGGTSTGILKAVTERLGKTARLTAVNHWKTAVNSHVLNHPEVQHLCESVENIDPRLVVKSGRLHLLAASCECRFHSNARGGGPCNEQSRSQPWQLIRWASDIRVDNIMMENVREFRSWGPLHGRTKRPIKSRKGEYFKAFCVALESLGYQVEFRIQSAADYGDPTSRLRLILIARRGNKVVWPEATHGPGKASAHRTARECIDWDLKGKSILEREKPLCANTLRRIAAGLRKFGGANAEPFLVLLRGTSAEQIEKSAHSLDEPMPTITGGGHLVMCEPFVLNQQSGATAQSVDTPMPTVCTAGKNRLVEPFITAYHCGHDLETRNHSIDEPLPTQDTSNRFALVEPYLMHVTHHGADASRCHSVEKPMPTITGAHRGEMMLVEPMVMKFYKTGRCKPVSEPLDTVTTKARFMLVECEGGGQVEIGIRTRMLQPGELAAAHSFPKAYRFTGSKEEQTKQIGNSVPVELACAHAEVALREN